MLRLPALLQMFFGSKCKAGAEIVFLVHLAFFIPYFLLLLGIKCASAQVRRFPLSLAESD